MAFSLLLAYLFVSSLCLVWCPVAGKVYRGTVSSQRAWEENGQFVTKFCFHDQKALFRFTSNATSEGKWHFYLDEHWQHASSEPDCEKKIAMSRFKVNIAGMSGSQYVNQWIRPHFWFLVYADSATCLSSPPLTNEVIEFEMEFLNPDSSGAANDHFGDDLRGQLHSINRHTVESPIMDTPKSGQPPYNGQTACPHCPYISTSKEGTTSEPWTKCSSPTCPLFGGSTVFGLLLFYCLLVFLYIAGLALYAHRVWITISKGGPMHEVLQMLSLAMGLHFTAAVLMLLHLWRYSANGEGIPVFSVLSEVLEMLAQCQMIWMLLGISVGWTVSSNSNHPIRDKKQLLMNVTVTILHILLVLWEQSYDESHYTYHVHENLPGWLLVLLRIGLALLIGYNLHRTTSEERSALKKDFYHGFAIGCYLWFFAFPVLMLVAMVFTEYFRLKVVTVGTTVIQTASMVILSRLFLSRSLYWEVSSLSSTTLPFKRDRGGGGFMTLLNNH